MNSKVLIYDLEKKIPYSIYPNIDLIYKINKGININSLRLMPEFNTDESIDEFLSKFRRDITSGTFNVNQFKLTKLPKYMVEDKDTLFFRINDCLNNGGTTLDISNLGLIELPNIPKTVKYLFCSCNKITKISLSYLKTLELLDCSTNKISEIEDLPESLIELLCKDNRLENINTINNCNKLERLDCSNNKISSIPKINSLRIIKCSYNKITELPALSNLKILICKHNKLKSINKYNKLVELECNNNNIQKLDFFPNLESLFCENNKIEQIDINDRLMILYCHKNRLTRINFAPNLLELVCDYNDGKISISKRYNVKEARTYEDNIIQFLFK